MATQAQLDFRKRWTEALRSGKYTQGPGALKCKDKYCCLGVLCDLTDPTRWVDSDSAVGKLGYNTVIHVDMPPVYIRDTVGITTSEACRLAEHNDRGSSFEEIAKIIEQFPVSDSPLTVSPVV